MKPYKIFKNQVPLKKKIVYLDKLRPPKVPLWFTKTGYTPIKRQIVID